MIYLMIINKPQGQLVSEVEMDLRLPVLTHEQIYVAMLICLQRTHMHMRHIVWRSGSLIGRRSRRSDQQQRKEASDQECWAEIWLGVVAH